MNGIEREQAEAASIEREFPGWAAWVGIDNMWHARRVGADPIPANRGRGEDAQDLRDMIRGWNERQPS